MYESWLIISDVGREPNYRGEWPKLAVVHVISEHKIGALCLGNSNFLMVKEISHEPVIEAITCAIQYFNDSDDPSQPDSQGTIAELNVKPLYNGNDCPVQLCCDEISEAEFGTHIAFNTLPELKVIPRENKT
jgi:hypothetical protein